LLATTKVFTFRVKEGDDASCLNLYQTRQPRVLGVSKEFLEYVAEERPFAWTDRGDVDAEGSPWSLLAGSRTAGAPSAHAPPIPVILDANTAAYSLHLGGVGAEFSIEDESGRPRMLRVAALSQIPPRRGFF
jgi:hypothetical protein